MRLARCVLAFLKAWCLLQALVDPIYGFYLPIMAIISLCLVGILMWPLGTRRPFIWILEIEYIFMDLNSGIAVIGSLILFNTWLALVMFTSATISHWSIVSQFLAQLFKS